MATPPDLPAALARAATDDLALRLDAARDDVGEGPVESRELAATAVGVVMERFGLDRDRAFEYLLRVSAASQVKLRVVAEELLAGQRGEGSRA